MAALSHRPTIDQLTFDLKFISHVKSSRPFGKIATDDVRAVKDLLLAGTEAHGQQQGAFYEIQVLGDLLGLHTMHNARQDFACAIISDRSEERRVGKECS